MTTEQKITEIAKHYAERYEAEKQGFAKEFAENPAYTIAWRGESMTIAQKMYEIVARADLAAKPERVAAVVAEIRTRLCERLVGRASSTGHFHNAGDHAEAEAHARVLRDLAKFAK